MQKINKIEIQNGNNNPSCVTKPPLIKFQEQQIAVPILNYNLPQSTCFDAIGFLPLDIPVEYFFELPIIDPINPGNIAVAYSAMISTPPVSFRMTTPEEITAQQFKIAVSILKIPNYELISDINDVTILLKLRLEFEAIQNNDQLPEFYKTFSGKIKVRAAVQAERQIPQIIIMERYKICSFLGDYGAGKTVKTFSLLPGEKTTISIRSFQKREETRKKAENVLDSFSESSADELEKMVENESAFSSSRDQTTNLEFSTQSSASAGGGLSLGIFKAKAKFSAGFQAGASTTINTSRAQNTRTLVNSVSKHTTKSDSFREIEVNVETSISSISETETTIIREIENLNRSRVLNSVFRQLVQEFITFTYLDGINIIFTDGTQENTRVVDISNLEGLLNEVIPQEDNREEVFRGIIKQYCNVIDYKGHKIEFLEKVDDIITDCFFGEAPDIHTYFRKRQTGLMDDNENNEDVKRRIPGVILDISERIIRTSGIIVDSLLGQGEALDCYNQELQEAATTKAHLENIASHFENRKIQEAVEALNKTTDPEEKAKIFKMLFKECCKEKVIIKDLDIIENP